MSDDDRIELWFSFQSSPQLTMWLLTKGLSALGDKVRLPRTDPFFHELAWQLQGEVHRDIGLQHSIPTSQRILAQLIEAEANAWIPKYGSALLVANHAAGYLDPFHYWTERLEKERPGWRWFVDTPFWREKQEELDCLFFDQSSLDLLRNVRVSEPNAYLAVFGGAPVPADTRRPAGRPVELVVMSDFLKRPIVFEGPLPSAPAAPAPPRHARNVRV
jgi:hypothetical protein